MLWNAKLHLKGKLSLIPIFGAGVFVMIAGILRCVVIIKVRFVLLSNHPLIKLPLFLQQQQKTKPTIPNPQDPTNGIQTATSWALRETFIATLLTNAPMIHPLLLHGVDKASSYHSSTSDRATRSVRLHSSIGSHPALRSVTTLPTTTCNPNDNDTNDNDDDDDSPPAPPTRPRNRSSANRLSAILTTTSTTTTNRLSALLTRTPTDNSNTSTKDLTDRDTNTKTTRNRSSSRLSSLLLNIAESTTRSDDDYDYEDDLELATTTKRSRSRSRAASAASWRPTRPRSASPAASSALSMGGIMVKKEAVVSSEERTSTTTTATTTAGVSKHSPSSSSASNGELLPVGNQGDGGVEVVQLGERCTLRPEGEGLEYTAFVGRGDGDWYGRV